MLKNYQVRPLEIGATVDPDLLPAGPADEAVELTFTDGYRNERTAVPLRLPVARTVRREGALSIDGALADWSADDAVHDGPLAVMESRPAVQSHAVFDAATPTSVYTGWSDTDFYVAFKVEGVADPAGDAGSVGSGGNYVRTQFRRAWGEDVCQILAQGVWPDGTAGPIVHVAPKPNGAAWAERKPADSRGSDDDDAAWQPLSAGVRYWRTMEADGGSGVTWRGEVAIPWDALTPPGRDAADRPALLRFNFAQHRRTTGESATWAGPVDFGRDGAFTGALWLDDPQRPGMARN